MFNLLLPQYRAVFGDCVGPRSGRVEKVKRVMKGRLAVFKELDVFARGVTGMLVEVTHQTIEKHNKQRFTTMEERCIRALGIGEREIDNL